MYFQNYRLWKSCLDYSPRSVVSEHALTVNMSKCPKILEKSPGEHFYHVFSSLSLKLNWKMSPLVLGEIVEAVVKTWLLMASILYKIGEIFNSQFKCNYLKNEKHFLNFLFHFWNPHQILKISKKRMIVIANVFPKLQTLNILLRPLSNKPCVTTHFDSQQVKASHILVNSPWERIYHVFS